MDESGRHQPMSTVNMAIVGDAYEELSVPAVPRGGLINQSIQRTVGGGEPDVIHRTSWRESTGECSERRQTFGYLCALKRVRI